MADTREDDGAALTELVRSAGLIDELADVVYALRIEPDPAFEYVSPSVFDLTGYAPEEYYADTRLLFTLVDPRDHDVLATAWTADVGDLVDMTVRWITRNGHTVWTNHRCRKSDRADGSIVLVGAARDVTAQHRSDERFRASVDVLLDPLSIMSAVRDETGQIVDLHYDHVTLATSELYQLPVEAIVGQRYLELFTDPNPPELFGWCCDVIETGEPFRHEVSFTGGAIDATLIVSMTKLGDGLVVTAHDITDRMQSEKERVEREELLRVVLDNSGDGTMRLAPDLRLEYVNQRIVDLSGLPLDAWIGRSFTEVGYSEEEAASWERQGRRVFETGQPVIYQFEVATTLGDRWFEASASPEFAPDGSVAHVVATLRDVTDRRIAEKQLLQLATRDPLTGLVNRTALLDEITRALRAAARSGRSTAVLMIDLDHFKYVNDSLGHAVGDELLQAAARRLQEVVRGGDLVARPGGDEFVIVMRDLDDHADAVRAARRLVTAFRDPISAHDTELYTTASIGIAVASDESEADDLVREADTAMYVAKAEGRDRVSMFNEELRAAVTSRLSLEGNLRPALERDELAVWYQPEVGLASGSVIAVEGLLRWHHPDGRLRTAAEFIDIAEETGLILDIGDWVLQEACSQAARWAAIRPGRPISIRVNLSALQLAEAGLLDAVDAALDASGLDPGLLCLEITETALLRETSTVRENLDGVRERGIAIAVDDFGTGYASLAYLRKYPVDVLKIDRSFITDLTTDDYDERLVAGIVALAHRLGMSVTAEGVERDTQADLLRELGCESAQGFLFSKAVPPGEIDALFDLSFLRR